MAWLDPLRAQLDLLTGRFVAGYAVTTEEREGVSAAFAEARAVERPAPPPTRDAERSADRQSLDALIFVRDLRDGQIVGGMRIAPGDARDPEADRAFALHAWPAGERPRVDVATRIALRKAHRRTAARLTLVQFWVREGLERGSLWAVLACEPALLAFYRRLGFQPHAAVHAAATGGFRLPMVLVLHDEAHLAAIGSPLLATLRRTERPFPTRAIVWWRQFQADHPTLEAGVDPMRVGDLPEALVDGVSLAGQTALADHGFVLRCQDGDPVIVHDEGTRSLFVVVAGAVEVVADARHVTRLEATETFGELSLILGSRRTADVLAASPDTRVAMLSQSAIDRVKAPADREAVWRNLARIVARRLLEQRDRR